MNSSAAPSRRAIAVVLLGCAGALIAGCGSTAAPGAAPGATVTVTSPPPAQPSAPGPASAPSASSPAVPPCATSALSASIEQSEGTAGSIIYPIVLTNTSGAACTLYGYPGVSLVTGRGGSQIGSAATENGAFARTLVHLAPGGDGAAQLQVAEAANYPAAQCHMVTAHWLKVYPPGQLDPLYVSFTTPTCASTAKAVHILSVETVQPGNGSQ